MKKALIWMITAILAIFVAFTGVSCKAAETAGKATEDVASESSVEVKGTSGGTLSILCFKGYAEDDWVKPFEKKYNCTVKVTYAGTIEEHFAKAKATPDQYNIVSIDSGRLKMYYDAGLIKPIDISKLENYKKIDKFFTNNAYAEMEKGIKYHIPIAWGSLDFIVNMKAVGDSIKPYLTDIGNGKATLSYDIMKAPEFKDKVTMMDEAANITTLAAINTGNTDPYNLSAEGYDAMKKELTSWAKNCRTFHSGFEAELSILTAEDAYISITGGNAPIALELAKQGLGDKFENFLATQGVITWLDGWVITKPTEGDSLDLALKYIDYMDSDEVQAKVAALVGYGIVNPGGSGGVSDVVKNKVWWYSGSLNNFPVKSYLLATEENPEKRVQVWTEIKSGLGF
jgi:spermidine/putrescine transport system substrate-binding protein